MPYHTKLLLLLALLFLSACGMSDILSSTPPATPTPAPTATPPPTPTSAPTPTPTTGKVVGRVFRSDTDAPIANASVELHDLALDAKDPGWKVAEVSTDKQGRYSFDGIKPGKYSLSVFAAFKNEADMPCPAVADTLLSITVTQSGWLARTGIQESTGQWAMIAVGGEKDEMSVAAGDVLQKDIDLKCK
jgi:hypothetical protein